MHATLHLLTRTDFPRLTRRAIETLQLNLGYGCTAGQGSSCGGALGNETAPAPSCSN